MACRLADAKSLLKLCLHNVNSNIENKIQLNPIQNSFIFIQENAFENVGYEMVSILPRPQCVNKRSKVFYLNGPYIWSFPKISNPFSYIYIFEYNIFCNYKTPFHMKYTIFSGRYFLWNRYKWEVIQWWILPIRTAQSFQFDRNLIWQVGHEFIAKWLSAAQILTFMCRVMWENIDTHSYVLHCISSLNYRRLLLFIVNQIQSPPLHTFNTVAVDPIITLTP